MNDRPGSERDPLVEFCGADLGYRRAAAVIRGVNLSVCVGDFLGVVGPNGCGKSTLLRATLGVLRPLRGEVRRRRPLAGTAYVPQRAAIDEAFPLTVMDIVLMGRYPRIGVGRRPGESDIQAACETACALGIGALLGKRYGELSGGEQQRTLIARALCTEPVLLVLDEPTTGMDLPGEKAIMDLIRSLHEKRGLSVIMASHLLNVVAAYVDRLALIENGRITTGPVEEMLDDETLSRLYESPVRVHRVAGRPVVMAEGGDA